jgi:glycopeptide antibiotics resistance protein
VNHPLRHRFARWVLVVALVVQLVVLALIVLNPSPAVPTRVVLSLSYRLQQVGVPAALADGAVIEFALNVGMFVPLGITLALLLPRIPWWVWALVGLAISSLIEAAQLLFLSARSATLVDVWANTLGLAAGGLLVAIAFQLLRKPSAV